jgi:hypothetical protein
LLTATC